MFCVFHDVSETSNQWSVDSNHRGKITSNGGDKTHFVVPVELLHSKEHSSRTDARRFRGIASSWSTFIPASYGAWSSSDTSRSVSFCCALPWILSCIWFILINNQITQWNRVHLERLTDIGLIMKLVFYRTRTLINVVIRACYWNLSWARWLLSTHLHLYILDSF